MKNFFARSRLWPAALAFASAGAIAADVQAPKTADPAATPAATLPADTSSTTLAQAKFNVLDTDHNGSVDKHEAMASSVLTTAFDLYDGDHDGKLSLTEFATINDLAAIKVDRTGY